MEARMRRPGKAAMIRRAAWPVAAAAVLLAGACTTPPTVQGRSSLADLAGRPAALSKASDDALAAKAAQMVAGRFVAAGAPAYRLEVTYARLPPYVGVSAGSSEADWVVPPSRSRLFRKPLATRALTVVGLDAATGRTAFRSTVSEPARGDDADALPRLVAALFDRVEP